MSKKPRLLIFIDWYLPAYKAGGPVRSVFNMVRELKDEFDIYVYTSDRDLGDENPFEGIKLNQWIEEDGYRVLYNSPDHQNLKTLKPSLREIKPDIVYINSMFSWSFSILPLWAMRRLSAKVVLAPRGMLKKGALSIKPIKKSLFLALGKKIGLFKNVEWHATSMEEENEIQGIFGTNGKIQVLSNIPDLKKTALKRSKRTGHLDLLFLARISAYKNLDFALQILNKSDFNGNVSFNIYGPIEDSDYWEKCNLLIKEIHGSKSNIQIEYHGPINPSFNDPLFSSSHLLFFPTKHENYGHVIAEALSSGMPVLLSDNTPWRDLEKQKVGFDLSLDQSQEFTRALQYFLDMGQDAYDIWSANARKFVLEKTNLEEMRSAYKDLFLPHG